MAAPTSYTEETFKAYLADQLTSVVGSGLNWTVDGGNYDEIVNECELVLELAIADATNIRALRAVGRRELWRTVMQATSNKATAHSGMNGSVTYGKNIFDRAQELFKAASEEVEKLLVDTASSKSFQGWAST